MIIINDDQVKALVSMADAKEALRAAFLQLGKEQASDIPRHRYKTTTASINLASMGAYLSAEHIAGFKTYTTIAGKFSFLVNLFSSITGEVLAALPGNALTEIRTPSTTALAVEALGYAQSRNLVIFGTGIQARAHVGALGAMLPLQKLTVVGIDNTAAFADWASSTLRIDVQVKDAQAALDDADIVVTATRATEPLFDGAWLRPGTLVAAIGASKKDVREIDATTIARAQHVVVETRQQALLDAGDLVLAGNATRWAELLQLGDILAGTAPYARKADDIVLYKAVGIGLEDIAIANLAYQRYLAQHHQAS